MKAALQLFGEKGIDCTSIEEITERADVGKGTFYNHFENKETIAVALIENAVDKLIHRIEVKEPKTANLSDALEHLVRALSAFFEENQEEYLLLFQGRLLLKLQRETFEDLEAPYIRYLEAIENEVKPFLHHAVDSSRIRRFACALAGVVTGFFSFAMIGMTPEEMENSLGPMRRAFIANASAFIGS